MLMMEAGMWCVCVYENGVGATPSVPLNASLVADFLDDGP